ncbi:MAG: mechanosensitive ion channel family protein [Bacteroidia bacterium]
MEEFLGQEFFGNSVRAYLIFGGLIILAILFKRIGARFISKILIKAFQRFFDKEHVNQYVNLIRPPLEMLILILMVYIALQTLSLPVELTEEGYWSKSARFTDVLFQIFMLVLFVWLIFRVIDVVATILFKKAELSESRLDDQLVPFFKEMSKIVAAILAFIFMLGAVFHLNVSSLIAGIGIGGLAIALAAQETLANLFASFAIFLDKPFQVGDLIQVDDIIGEVTHVGFRSSRIRTLDKSYLTLPNKMLVDRKVDNLSLRTFRRVNMTVGVTYSTTPKQIYEINAELKQFLDDHESTNPDSIVRLHDFGDSSLNILLIYFITDLEYASYLKIREEVNYKVMEIVEKHQSSIAFPTRTLHLFDETKMINTENE